MQADIFCCALGLVEPWFIKKIEFDATLKKLLFTLISRQAAGLRLMVSLAQCMIRKLKLGDISISFSTNAIFTLAPPAFAQMMGGRYWFFRLGQGKCMDLPFYLKHLSLNSVAICLLPRWQK